MCSTDLICDIMDQDSQKISRLDGLAECKSDTNSGLEEWETEKRRINGLKEWRKKLLQPIEP